MRLWRISNHRNLSGEGGFHSAGRWHSIGRPIVYAAESSALAILEALVHFELAEVPPPYQLLQIDLPDELDQVRYPHDDAPDDEAESARWGDEWLAAGGSALASVPAAVAPYSRNWLINPLHADAARIRIAAASRWPWDKRLFRSG